MRYLPAIVLAIVAGCGGVGAATEPPVPPVFDIDAVRADFADDCQSSAVIDELFCEQVDVEGMTADGEILNVPTTLDPEAKDRGDVLCDLFALAHFDANGAELGYTFAVILDRAGGKLAACRVRYITEAP